MQRGVGEHDVVGQPIRIQVFPALERYSLAAFGALRRLAARVAGKVGIDGGAFRVLLDFHHQMLAVSAADDEIRRVVVPAAVLAQILGEQLGLGRIGEAAGEPQAFDGVGVVLQQAQGPVEEFRLGTGIEVVELVVET